MRKEATLEYENYLNEIIALTGKVKKPNTTTEYPASLNTSAKRNLYDNLSKNEALANELDYKILTTKKDAWKDNKIKTKEVKIAIKDVLKKYEIAEESEVYRILDLVKNQRDY